MGKSNITLNILSHNNIEPNIKFVNTITRVLTGIIFIVAIFFYFKNQSLIELDE